MKKADLIAVVAKKNGLKGKEANDIVNMVFDGFTLALKKGGRIEIRGFGSFSVRSYKPYTGRNPKTGSKAEVGAKKLPYFNPTTIHSKIKD